MAKEAFFKKWDARISFSITLPNEDYQKLMSIVKREWKGEDARRWLAAKLPIDQLTLTGYGAS